MYFMSVPLSHPPVLRLEVHRRPVAPVHIERHRHMFMGDHPLAVDLATADGRAHPDIGFLAVAPRSADPVKAAAEADVIARSDVEVANLVANRASETGKPLLEALL